MERSSYDTVIIGGGLVGLFTAYHLKEAGTGPVLVLDRSDLNVKYTGAYLDAVDAARTDYEGLYLDAVFRRLVRLSRELLVQLSAGTEIDFELRPKGLLAVAFTQDELKRMAGTTESCVDECPRYEIVDHRAVRVIEPQLSLEVIGGLWLPDALHLDFPRIGAVLTEHLSRRGVEILPYCSAIGAKHEGARLVGLQTTCGWVRAGRYVSCVARPEHRVPGFPLPFAAAIMHGLAIGTQPMPAKLHTCVVRGIGLTQRTSGNLVAAESLYPRKREDPGDKPGFPSIFAQVVRMLPCADNLRTLEAWSRYEVQTDDQLPVIGKVSGLENAYVGLGSSGSRHLVAPIIAKLLAALITTGETRDDLATLSPTRFLDASGPQLAGPPPPADSLQGAAR